MRVLLDLVFPPACVACEEHGHRFLCPACLDSFPHPAASCLRCALPLPVDEPSCVECEALEPAFSATRAAAIYDGVARDALMSFKLGGERRAAAFLADMMAPRAYELDPDVITFVPSARRTTARRGFDPALELARHLGRGMGIPARPLLRKVRATADQAGLNLAQRRSNQAGAYRATRPARARRVLLVDDILTTGATADACAGALRDSGIPDVAVCVFARVP